MRTLMRAGTIVAIAGTTAQANMILNGSFESNAATATTFNMTNATFNSTVNDATAFGGSEEMDLVTGTDFGVSPQSGNWKMGLHQRTNDPNNVDAFSFDLSGTVVAGNVYTLTFYAAGLAGAPLGPAEIGLSSSPTSFGTHFYSGTPVSDTSWSFFSHTFTAPVTGSYLTVRNSLDSNMYVFVDNFTLVPTPGTLSLVGLGGLVAARRRR